MRALTLHRPWPFMIFHLPPHLLKRIENRPWGWASLLGETITIHAGKTFDDHALESCIAQLMQRGHRIDRDDPRLRHQGLIGTVRITAIADGEPRQPRVKFGPGDALANHRHGPWYVGPNGLVMDEAHAFQTPIACSGAQGLWRVKPELVAAFT